MNTKIIIKPLITEQSMKAVDTGKYTFAVVQFASKIAIKNAINELFGVTVVSVATSVVKGKTKRTGAKRQEVRQSIWKKAIIKLKDGEKIGLFEPGGEEQAHAHKHK
jgi:large subunit ribosomal protein L23